MPRILLRRPSLLAILSLPLLASGDPSVTTRAPSSNARPATPADIAHVASARPGPRAVATAPEVSRAPAPRSAFVARGPRSVSPGDEVERTPPRPGSYADIRYREAIVAEILRRDEAARDRAIAPAPPAEAQAGQQLGSDVRANDRNPLTCTQCQNRPLIQTEAAVAVLGSNVVASWNEGESSCQTNTRMNFGWSTDGGLTFTDVGGFAPPGATSPIGDAVVQVNAKTGRFYLSGIGSGGVSITRGSFGGGGFTPDVRVVATSGAPGLHDKPWMNVDSLSGNVYVAWTRFADPPRVEFQALNADLVPIGPVHTCSDTTSGSCGAQWSQIVVGPDGEVWVSWLAYDCASPYLTLKVRRSDDHGLTFGPAADVVTYAINTFTGGVGFLRAFAATPSTLAVDRSNGPHRGRLYLSYDAPLNYRDDAIPITTAMFESEPNNTQATANTMNLTGGRLRGIKSGAESDWFKLDLQAGETFFMETIYSPAFDFDSTRASLFGRIWCPSGGGQVQAMRSGLTSNGLLFTARHTQTYYLEMVGQGPDTAAYVFTTAAIPVMPSDVGLDSRDQLLTWSDDGINWSTPVRLTDTPPGVDGQYPTVGVDGRGRVHAFWMDFRDDTECGLISNQYMRSSGDGGVTWGPARLITGSPSGWAGPYCNQLNGNTQGDYQSIATDGDVVVAAFNDARLGDPDIFLDVANHSVLPTCAPLASAIAGVDTLVDFALTNTGNYDRTLVWRVEETRGWLTSVSPAPSGSQSVAVGSPLSLHAMVNAPDCDGDSSIVRWITSDPFMPGYEDTCVTVIRCRDMVTPVLASLVSARATSDRVTLRWSLGDPSYLPAGVWRRTQTTPWAWLGAGSAAGPEVQYEDASVIAGSRYAYRLEIRRDGVSDFVAETWVDVPVAPRFEIAAVIASPSSRDLEVAFSLATGEAARLELFDIAGRAVVAQPVGSLGPGSHRVRLEAGREIASGIYTVRLAQGGRRASRQVSIVR